MNKEISIPGRYIIRFQTAGAIPAPFSHYDSLELNILSTDKLDVDFAITYLDRDELTEDEIFDEGFTMDDDFKWKGSVSPIWTKEFQDILASSKIIRKREEKEFEDFVEIEFEEDGKFVTAYPVDTERWAYFIQEFMQGILEIAGREMPFELTFMDVADKTTTIDLKASFADKSFSVKNAASGTKTMEWKKLQSMLDIIYNAEFIADEALTKTPSRKGKYISAGDGLWYELGVAVVDSSGKGKALVKIEELFNSLAS